MAADRPASTSSRNARVKSSSVASKPNPRKLPARVGREEIAVRGPAMAARGRAARALEDQLAAHELAVIFADCALGRRKTGVWRKGARGPFPDVPEHAAAWPWSDRSSRIELIAQLRIGGSRETLP